MKGSQELNLVGFQTDPEPQAKTGPPAAGWRLFLVHQFLISTKTLEKRQLLSLKCT